MRVKEAAIVSGCSETTLLKLIREGKVTAERVSARSPLGRWKVTMDRAELRRAVAEAAPLSGYKKYSNGHKPVQSRLESPSNGLALLLQWAQVPAEKREPLLELASKFTATELVILKDL